LGIYFLYFVYFSLLALALGLNVPNMPTNLSTDKGANEGDGQDYLPDDRANERVRWVVDDVSKHASLPGARISTKPRRSICLMICLALSVSTPSTRSITSRRSCSTWVGGRGPSVYSLYALPPTTGELKPERALTIRT
jgi:hypothetical protein